MDYIVRLSVKADSEPEAIAKVSGGKVLSIYPQPALGDKIAAIANPIAKALKLPCIDKKTGKLKPDSGCGKMKKRLNDGMPVAEAMRLRLQGK